MPLTLRPLALALALTATASHAADSKQVCGDAYGKGQDLRDKSSLLEAREELRLCAQPTCKDFIVKSCTEWLAEVEKRIPSVVFVAQTSNGDALVDVHVSDGKRSVAASLDGKAIEIDPGVYDFTFTSGEGKTVTVKAIVAESQKAQLVRATFPVDAPVKSIDTKPTPAPTPSPALSLGPTTTGDAGVQPTMGDRGGGYRVAGWTMLGGGIVVGGVGAVLAIVGNNGKNVAGCGAEVAQGIPCTSTSASDSYNTARVEQGVGIGLAVGGGAVALTGLIVLLIAPSRTESPKVSLGGVTISAFNVGPTGFAIGGSF